MEDYTYHLTRERRSSSAPTCSRSARRSRRSGLVRDPPALIGGHDPVRLVFTAASGPAVLIALLDLGDRFRLIVNEIDVVEPQEPLPRLPVARALWRPRPEFATATEAWLEAGGPHHSVFSAAVGVEAVADLAEIAGIELVVIDGDTRFAASRTSCAGTPPITASPGCRSVRRQVGPQHHHPATQEEDDTWRRSEPATQAACRGRRS